uniref:Transient receptor potential cation channel subfamily M member 3 n=1 Tax=Plectus sambesii TaxID=2011161 RepID=A0A914VVH5_9BILA
MTIGFVKRQTSTSSDRLSSVHAPATTPNQPVHLRARYDPARNSVVSYLSAPRNSLTVTAHNLLSVAASLGTRTGMRTRTNTLTSLLNGNRVVPLDDVDDARPTMFARALSQKLTTTWIEQVFQKRECAKFIASAKDANKCGCGRNWSAHSSLALNPLNPNLLSPTLSPDATETKSEDERTHTHTQSSPTAHRERWTISRHTIVDHTDAFGTIQFQGGPHPHKSQYVRLGFDTDPADIMYLFEKVWQIEPPKLVITVHGGIANFDMQLKLARVFRKGLLKAAKTTGAWIITSGIDAGVVRHVAAALEGGGAYSRSRSKIVTIGIAPWGLLKKREEFIGRDGTVSYHPHGFSPKGRFAVLNDRHSYFLLVDNGTVGRYGADIILRKRLEEYISQKQTIAGGMRRVPVVCVALEGGTCTVRAVLDYVTNIPPVPVVVCDGSGRAADLLAFAHQYALEDGTLPDGVKPQLLGLVQSVFGYSKQSAEKVILELMLCVRKRHLITVFRLGEDQQQDLDHSILTALLKGQNLSAPDQLALALAWNRVDIAQSDIFVLGQDWPPHALHNAMMEALIYDRVDFVRLLLENGVSMEKFLTFQRLEELYNTDKGPPNTLYYIVRHVVKIGRHYQYTIPDIGLALEKLMGSAYQSTYTSREFRIKYSAYRELRQEELLSDRSSSTSSCDWEDFDKLGPDNMTVAWMGSRALRNHILWRSKVRRDKKHRVAPMQTSPNSFANLAKDATVDTDHADDDASSTYNDIEPDFKYPFNELLLWAVLTKRQEMARCMWQHGEEASAKALVACRLYKCLAKEAAEDYLEVEICEELRKYAEEFRTLSLELLEHCYQQDEDQTLQLLTYELRNWGNHTCLSLAVIANNKDFLANPCCQILLADLWHGGLRIRSQSNMKVIMGLLCPPSILLLEFKSREELMQQPQTAAEHADDLNADTSSADSDDSGRESLEGSDDDDDVETLDPELGRRRKSSTHGSISSANLASLFTDRSRHKQQHRHISTSSPPTQERKMSVRKSNTRKTERSDSKKMKKGKEETQRVPAAPEVPMVRPYSFRRNGHSGMPTSNTAIGFNNPNLSLGGNQLVDHHGGSLPNFYKAPNISPAILTRVRAPRSLRLRRKFYEFYVAPITTFWAWVFSFIVFLLVFTYVLLIETPDEPTWIEWFLVAYVTAFGLEHLRKLLMSEPMLYSQKVKVFFNRYWNYVTTAAVVTFAIGFSFRMFPDTRDSFGRVILACNSVLWHIKLLDFMSIHPRLGPYITMAGKMVQNMSYIVVVLLVTLMAFGLARQSITYPHEPWNWLLVRNIFYKPYFMLYGEVYAGEIDTCGDEGTNCVPGGWIPPILMVIFLVIANILLISLLIAIFNNIFNETNAMSQQVWLFQRYEQVMEYESTPFLPPPFTPLYHIYMLFKYCRVRRRGDISKRRSALQYAKRDVFDFALKLFLDYGQVKKLHDFEEDCMDDLARIKEYNKNISTEERIHRTADRSEFMSIKLKDLATRESAIKSSVRVAESRLETIEQTQNEILACLRQLTVAQMHPVADISPALPVSDDDDVEQLSDQPTSAVVRRRSSAGGRRLSVDGPKLAVAPEAAESTAAAASFGAHKELIDEETPFDHSAPSLLSRAKRSLKPAHLPLRRASSSRSPSLGGEGAIAKRGQRPRPNTVYASYGRSKVGVEGEGEDAELFMKPLVEAAEFARPRVRRSITECEAPTLSVRQQQFGAHGSPLPSSPSARFRRNDEYTSITDYISVADPSSSTDLVVMRSTLDSPITASAREEESRNRFAENALSVLKRAKPSFVLRQNEMLREFEETSSRITGGLIEGRKRKETTSVSMTNDEELKEMGRADLDVKDYLQCLTAAEERESSLSSSMDSLSSARLEVAHTSTAPPAPLEQRESMAAALASADNTDTNTRATL